MSKISQKNYPCWNEHLDGFGCINYIGKYLKQPLSCFIFKTSKKDNMQIHSLYHLYKKTKTTTQYIQNTFKKHVLHILNSL